MMKICHVTSAHTRYDIRIFEKECTSLAQNGYEVYLIVNDDMPDEVKNGVHIISTGYVPQNRKDRMINSMKCIWEKIKEINAAVYHLHDPELMQLINKINRNNKLVIFDAHEDTSEQIMDKEWIPFPLRRIVSYGFDVYQKYMLKKCKSLVSVTPALVTKLKNINANVYMITNYPVIGAFKPQNNATEKSNYVFFAGGISSQWCHERIIAAIQRVNGVKYRLAGPVDEKYLSALKNTTGWQNVEFLGKISHLEVEEQYKKSIAGMAINECTQIKEEGTLGNTKIFEIMAAGIPVICTNYRIWSKIVNQYSCGIAVDSRSVEDIARAIQYIFDNPQEAVAMGRNGRRAIEEVYNWSTQEKILLDMYNAIIN